MENIVKLKKKSATNKIKRSGDDIAVDLIGGILLFLCGFVAILPFIMIAAGSVQPIICAVLFMKRGSE